MSLFDTNRKNARRPQQTATASPIDLSAIEKDIDESIRRTAPGSVTQLPPRPQDFAPPAVRAQPLPQYVDHHEEVDQVGRLSAEGIVMQYESAAKAIETMGNDLKKCAMDLERKLEQIDAAFQYVTETAQLYREEGKAIFERIEQASLLTSKVREACDDMRRKIDRPATSTVKEGEGLSKISTTTETEEK